MNSPNSIAWTLAGAGVAIAVVALIGTREEPRDRAPSSVHRFADLEQSVESLRIDVARLRQDLAEREPAIHAATPTTAEAGSQPGGSERSHGSRGTSVRAGGGSETSPAAMLAALKPEERERVEELRTLVGKFFGSRASEAETKRFWKLAKSGRMLDMALAAAEADVEADPQSVEARMQLAEVNVAKLYTLPRGAERRLWADQAQNQYRAILELDENNWEARNGLATGFFHTPANMNKTADAIREFEKLRAVQEVRAAEDRYAGVYVNLAILYRRGGDDEKARQVLEAGLRRYPQDEEIGKTLGLLKK